MFAVVAMLANGDLVLDWWSNKVFAVNCLFAYQHSDAFWAVVLDRDGTMYDAWFAIPSLSVAQRVFRVQIAKDFRRLHLDTTLL